MSPSGEKHWNHCWPERCAFIARRIVVSRAPRSIGEKWSALACAMQSTIDLMSKGFPEGRLTRYVKRFQEFQSIHGDDDLPPRMPAADVVERGAGLIEGVAPVDHRLQLAFAHELREQLQVGYVDIRHEEHQLLVDEGREHLHLQDACDGSEEVVRLWSAHSDDGPRRCDRMSQVEE